MHRLPECSSNRLLQLLLQRRQLSKPYQLEWFSYAASELHILPGLPQAELVDKSWLAYIQSFKHLTSLRLEGCPRVTDAPLSALWPALTSLTRLSLAHCTGISNAGLQGLSHLTRLSDLDLSGCSGLTAPLPLSHFPPSITHLSVADVLAFDDESAGQALSLPSLRHLTAWGTALTATGLQLLAFCPQLSTLDVSWTRVDLLPAIPTLTGLTMQHCELVGVWWPLGSPADTPSLQLSTLNLAESHIATSALPDLQRYLEVVAPSLVHLDLHGTPHLADLRWLLQAGSLRHLRLDGPRRADTLSPLAHATSLHNLTITHVNLSGEQDTWWLLSLTQLTSLSLAQCQVPDAALPVLWQLTRLQQLILDHSRVTGVTAPAPADTSRPQSGAPSRQLSDAEDIWRADSGAGASGGAGATAQADGTGQANPAIPGPSWGSLTGLRELSLVDSDISDAGLHHILSGALTLTRLVCGSAALSDTGLRGAAGIPCTLHELTLTGFELISATGVGLLRHLPELQVLNVSGCKLVRPSGSLAHKLLAARSLVRLTIDSQCWFRATGSDTAWQHDTAAAATGSLTPAVKIPQPRTAPHTPAHTPGRAPLQPKSTNSSAHSTPAARSAPTDRGWAAKMGQSPQAQSRAGSGGTRRTAGGPRVSAVPLVYDAEDSRIRYSSAQLMSLQEHGVGVCHTGLAGSVPPWCAIARELNFLASR